MAGVEILCYVLQTRSRTLLARKARSPDHDRGSNALSGLRLKAWGLSCGL